MSSWFVAVDGKSLGPLPTAELLAGLAAGRFNPATLVWREGFAGWQPIGDVTELRDSGQTTPPPVTGQLAHQIDYTIFGAEMQYVEIELDPQESVISEAGAMMFMSEQVIMQTIFGDGSADQQPKGFLDSMIGAGKRLITGEGLFVTMFTCNGPGKGRVAFASPYPGKIIPLDLKRHNGQIICQKDAFLCAAKGVAIGVAFQKKIGAALFGGEGFIMQKLEGDGLCFLHAGGTILEKELEAGEMFRVDTGCLVALTGSVHYDVEFVGNVKSALFGGEGFFLAVLRGPGHVWLQSLPFSRLAGRMYQAAPQTGSQAKGEGSILGGLSTMFER